MTGLSSHTWLVGTNKKKNPKKNNTERICRKLFFHERKKKSKRTGEGSMRKDEGEKQGELDNA